MISRKVEKILVVIAIVFNIIAAGLGGALLALNEENVAEINEILEISDATNLQTAEVLSEIQNFGVMVLISTILAITLSIVGLITLSKQKRSILSGVLFLLAALSVLIGTFIFGMLQIVILAIAGILAFVKKSNQNLSV